VDDEVYAKHRKTTHIDAEAHTSGTSGMTAAAKAAAKAEAKAKASPKKAAAKAAATLADDDIPDAEQHAFLDAAKDNKWDEVKRLVNAKPGIVSVQPCQRWSALHQAAAAGDSDVVKFLLDKNADVAGKTKDGQTPLDVAADASIKSLLKKRKAEDDPAPKAKAMRRQRQKPALQARKLCSQAHCQQSAMYALRKQRLPVLQC